MTPPVSAPTPTSDLAEVGVLWTEAMQRGDYEAAWCQTDRLELPRRLAVRAGELVWEKHHLVWDGSPFRGKHVLITSEHGLGDSIQYLRYCALVQREASRVTLRLQPALLPLCRGLEGVDELLDAWTAEPDPRHDVKIECMELAYAFRHTADTLPADVPYLPVERLLASPLPFGLECRHGDRKIGLIWAASAWNPLRSLPFPALTPLLRAPRCQFYSLQQGPEAHLATSTDLPIISLSSQTAEIAQAARAMLALDLIVTVDSMTAHLAGALGRPVWLLLTQAADWRWQSTGEQSPWYPTMRIFRQPAPADWSSVIESVQTALGRC